MLQGSWELLKQRGIDTIYLETINQLYLDVSENSGAPKSSILIGCSITNHPFWGTPIFGNTQTHRLIGHY